MPRGDHRLARGVREGRTTGRGDRSEHILRSLRSEAHLWDQTSDRGKDGPLHAGKNDGACQPAHHHEIRPPRRACAKGGDETICRGNPAEENSEGEIVGGVSANKIGRAGFVRWAGPDCPSGSDRNEVISTEPAGNSVNLSAVERG